MSTQHSPKGDGPNGLERLPSELVVRILEYCGYADLLRFSQVKQTCRDYSLLVETSARLRLQIELGANGLQLPHRWLAVGGQSQELLEKLVQCRDDWLDLRLTSGEFLPRTTSGQRFTLWELRRGVFASAFSMGEHRHLEADALKIITLDSPVSEWTLKFDMTFHELTIDPAQDLLVLAVTKTTSTVSLSITNDILLINLIANSSELCSNVMVIDWKAGVLLAHTGWRSGMRSAMLLHDDCLLVFETVISSIDEMGGSAIGKPDSLELFVYDQLRTPEGRDDDPDESRVHPSHPLSRQPLEETLRFEFPILFPNVFILATDFLVRAAPVSDCALHHTPDFVPDYTCRTISLSIRIISAGSPASLLIFVDSGMLLEHLKRAKVEGLRSVPWTTWGEYSTRWIYYMSEPNPWINWLQGTRYVLGRQVIDAQNHAEDNNYIAIADFHLPTIRRFAARNKDYYSLPLPEYEIKRREVIGTGQWAYFGNYSNRNLEAGALAVDIVDADTPTVLRGLSEDPIISRLPYRLAVARPSPSDYWNRITSKWIPCDAI
ncbi:hypothetical protein B0J17DRAFT_629739 [Rhizoctonia solani]|nr:hypothetical protein B0J17DRAFT_629739 [Rhizoctonia solani]